MEWISKLAIRTSWASFILTQLSETVISGCGIFHNNNTSYQIVSWGGLRGWVGGTDIKSCRQWVDHFCECCDHQSAFIMHLALRDPYFKQMIRICVQHQLQWSLYERILSRSMGQSVPAQIQVHVFKPPYNWEKDHPVCNSHMPEDFQMTCKYWNEETREGKTRQTGLKARLWTNRISNIKTYGTEINKTWVTNASTAYEPVWLAWSSQTTLFLHYIWTTQCPKSHPWPCITST